MLTHPRTVPSFSTKCSGSFLVGDSARGFQGGCQISNVQQAGKEKKGLQGLCDLQVFLHNVQQGQKLIYWAEGLGVYVEEAADAPVGIAVPHH